MSKTTTPIELTLTYSLFDLPSVQHKAGLAGLCLLAESLKRLKIEPHPEIEIGSDAAQTTTVQLTPESLKNLFNHFLRQLTVTEKSCLLQSFSKRLVCLNHGSTCGAV